MCPFDAAIFGLLNGLLRGLSAETAKVRME
jgi:hypothetical protein